MRSQHLIPSPNMLSNIHVYYQGDFLTETEASQFMHSSLLNQVNLQRNAMMSRSSNAHAKTLVKRPVSAKPLGSFRNDYKEMEGANQSALDTETMVDDLKFIRASLIDKDGQLLLKDGVNDKSSATYRRLEQLVRKRPVSAGTGLDNNLGKYTIRDMQVLRNNNFYELLPEAQRDLLDSNMRVDFSLFSNEKAQKELNESINFINKGIDLEAATHGMTEDVLSRYKRKRPASAHSMPAHGLLSPHSTSFVNQHGKTTSRPASMRRTSITSVQDLQDRLHEFTTNDTQSRCCFGDTYNSITQGHHPVTISHKLLTDLSGQPFTDTLVVSTTQQIKSIAEQESKLMLDQEPPQRDVVHADALNSDDDSTNNLVHSKIHTAPLLIPVPHQTYTPCNNDTFERKPDPVADFSYSHTKSERLTSTTDELSIDSEGNIYAIIGKKKTPPRVSVEDCINKQSQNVSMSALGNDAVEDHGEVILDEEIFETICSQHSTQSSAIESSLNASLTKLSASRSANRSKPYQKPRSKVQSQDQRNALTTVVSEESNFRQILHSDRKFPASFQPRTTHVAASHSTLDISEGPIEIRRIWRTPHSTGRPAPTPQIDNLSTVKEMVRSASDICHSEQLDTTTDSAGRLDRRIIVPERQGFKGSVITSYQRAIATRNKELSERDIKTTSISEHIVDLKKVYSGFSIDKNSFSTENSAPLMTIKATIPYTASQHLQKQLTEQLLEDSSEAIAPAEQNVGTTQNIKEGLQTLIHPTPPQCSQIDTYPIRGSLEYSGKKEDMEDVVDLPEESSNVQSISCLINSQLQRSDLETSLVIPRMDVVKHLEQSADLLGSIAGEPSLYSDDLNQRDKIVLRRGSGQKDSSTRRTSNTDRTSRDQSLYERMHDFRETVKQELSQQASLSAQASKPRSSFTLPTDFEDLPPQTFIDTTVIPLQKRLDEAIAAAMSKKPRLPADESDTLANYIEIDDDKTDDRVATPTMGTLYSRQETPRPGDFSTIIEHAQCPKMHSTIDSANVTDMAAPNDVEQFAVSRSDTQKPFVDINHPESPPYPNEPRQTVVHVIDLENPELSKIEMDVYSNINLATHVDYHMLDSDRDLELSTKPLEVKELAQIDKLLKEAKRLNTSLQASVHKDQPSELPVDYEAKMVLDDYELDANFPILTEGESGIDPTGEKDVILANYRKLTMDAAQKRNLHLDSYPITSGKSCSMSGKSREENVTENNSDEDKESEVKWADTVPDDSEERYEPISTERRRTDKMVSWNWRMFAGQGSSINNTEQGHRRTSYTNVSAISATSQPARSDSHQKKSYNKFERFTPRQFLSSASMSHTFKPDQDTNNLGLSALNHSIVAETSASGPLCINGILPIQFEAVRDQFNHVASCTKSLLLTQDLEKSSALEQLDVVQTPEKSIIKNSNTELYTSFSGTPSRADHLSISRGKTVLSESAHSQGSKHSHGSTLNASAVQSTAFRAAGRSTKIKSVAISKLVEKITSVNSTTTENLAKLGYSKEKLASSRGMLSRNTSKYNDKLEKASLLLEKPKQKAGRVSSAVQSEPLSESISGYAEPQHSSCTTSDVSEPQAVRTVSNLKGSTFISSRLGGTINQQPRLLSSKATYEAQMVRIGGSARIKTRALHPERPVALKTTKDTSSSMHITPVSTKNLSETLPGRPDSGASRPGKLMKVTDVRIGRQNQEILASSSQIDARPYYGGSALFRPVDDMVVVAPSPATRNMVISMTSRGSANTPKQTTRDRYGRQSVIDSIVTSPAASKSLLSKRPRSAIASSARESISKTTVGTTANEADDSGVSLLLQKTDLCLEPISIMAKPLAVQSPDRILKDPYDVYGTLRDEAERFIPCRGFRVNSAGKLRLPSTIEKDLVVNIRPLTAKVSATTRM
ncbi:Hypothetical protein GLP15_4180 [Giardia lamblia P15]|uniref:Uncharacterized protein n=1 Tax=Giardia intestinalis (strain P15) TaxID=658858 RepID=E1EYF0_GIAIA|nr:Hypothetical protein GLP15_4180 [Giardia lamblia P15]